jgi:hypothetical protein
MLEIAKMLVLSTAHVDEDTALRLTKGLLPTGLCTTYGSCSIAMETPSTN